MDWRARIAGTLTTLINRSLGTTPAAGVDMSQWGDLPLTAPAPAPVVLPAASEATIGFGGMVADGDDHLYRRVTSGRRTWERNLSPLAHDQMLRLVWSLFETNALAKRLITLMTDLIVGEGITIESDDPRTNDEIGRVWNPRTNPLLKQLRPIHDALGLDGELIVPVARNPFTGRPVYGYISPHQVLDVEPSPDNLLIKDTLILRPSTASEPPQRLKIVREDPETGRLEGEVFYHSINSLPNSTRGRSDLVALADWLDLYDRYLMGEVERVFTLSSFVWALKMTGATPAEIEARTRSFPDPRPGQVFVHNEREELQAVTPQLNAHEHAEIARVLRVHIAGSMGYPTSYLGDIDSNRSTIEGQNDIMLKTPAARQKDFAGFLDQLVRYGLEGVTHTNPALYRDMQPEYRIAMPEIAAKDITRVGTVISSIVSAMDTSMGNRTMSRKAAIVVQASLIRHLGIDLDPATVEAEADADAHEREERADLMQAMMAAGRGPAGRPNPPVPPPGDGDDEAEPAA